MNISGFLGLKNHLPAYSEKQVKLLVARLPGFAIISFILGIGFDYLLRFIFSLNSATFLLSVEPWIPILIPLILIFGGVKIVHPGFDRKEQLLKEDRNTAYQKVAKQIFSGIGMVFGGLLYGLINHGVYLFSFELGLAPINSLTTSLSQSLLIEWTGLTWLYYFQMIIGSLLLFIAIGTAFRAVNEFGIDNAALVYVYYPEESKVVQHQIYSIVRHPMYMSVILISFAGFCFNFSVYSFIHVFITCLSFAYHILVKEEKELIERFGESYVKYRKEVPAIFIRPKNIKKLIHFIFNKDI